MMHCHHAPPPRRRGIPVHMIHAMAVFCPQTFTPAPLKDSHLAPYDTLYSIPHLHEQEFVAIDHALGARKLSGPTIWQPPALTSVRTATSNVHSLPVISYIAGAFGDGNALHVQ